MWFPSKEIEMTRAPIQCGNYIPMVDFAKKSEVQMETARIQDVHLLREKTQMIVEKEIDNHFLRLTPAYRRQSEWLPQEQDRLFFKADTVSPQWFAKKRVENSIRLPRLNHSKILVGKAIL